MKEPLRTQTGNPIKTKHTITSPAIEIKNNDKDSEFKKFKTELASFFKNKSVNPEVQYKFFTRINDLHSLYQGNKIETHKFLSLIKIECAFLKANVENCIDKEFQAIYESFIETNMPTVPVSETKTQEEEVKLAEPVKEHKDKINESVIETPDAKTYDKEEKLIETVKEQKIDIVSSVETPEKTEIKEEKLVEKSVIGTPETKTENKETKTVEKVKLIGFDGNEIKVKDDKIVVNLSPNSNPAMWDYLITALSIQEGIQEKPKRIEIFYDGYGFGKLDEEYKFDDETLSFLDRLEIKAPRDYNKTRLFQDDIKRSDANTGLLKTGGEFCFIIKYQKLPCFSQGSGHVHIIKRKSHKPGWGTAITRFIVAISLKNPLLKGNIYSDTALSSHIFHIKMGMVPTEDRDNLAYLFSNGGVEDAVALINKFISLQIEDSAQLGKKDLQRLISTYKYIHCIPKTVEVTVEELFNKKQFFIDLIDEKGVPYLTHRFNPMVLNALERSIGRPPVVTDFGGMPMILSREGLAAWADDLSGKKKFESLNDLPQLNLLDSQKRKLEDINARQQAANAKRSSGLTPGA
jgi:hypothetical protein